MSVAPAQVVFVPENDGATFTDPSYHMPAFYTVWQETASSTSVANFAGELAASSREFFKLAAQSSTPGLMPDYSTFAGVPTGWRQDHEFDAWRVAMNVAIDYSWYVRHALSHLSPHLKAQQTRILKTFIQLPVCRHAADPWQVDYCNGLLEFHKAQNASGPYPDRYTLPNLQPLSNGHGPGPIGMNAVCALASDKVCFSNCRLVMPCFKREGGIAGGCVGLCGRVVEHRLTHRTMAVLRRVALSVGLASPLGQLQSILCNTVSDCGAHDNVTKQRADNQRADIATNDDTDVNTNVVPNKYPNNFTKQLPDHRDANNGTDVVPNESPNNLT